MLVDALLQRVRDQLYDVSTYNPLRYSDVDLLQHVASALRKLAEVRPESATSLLAYTLTASPRQRLPADTNLRVLAVLRNPDDAVTGAPVRYVERDVLDSFFAAWPTATGGPTVESRYQVYSLDAADPLAFWLFPAGQAGDVVTVKRVEIPIAPSLGSELPVADSYVPALVDYVTHACLLSEAGGLPTSDSQRYLSQFLVALGVERAVQHSVGQEAARPPEAKA